MAVTITATGPTALRTFAFPDADATMLTSHDLVTVPQGGTGKSRLTAHGVLVGEGASAIAALAAGAANTLLHGAGGSADPAFSAVVEGDVTLADVTTLNVSTTKHGLAPKAPNDVSKFLDGTGAFSRPVLTDIPSSVNTQQDNWAPGLAGDSIIRWSGNADTTFTGYAGGVLGQIVIFKNIGSHNAFFSHNVTSTQKFENIVTSCQTPVAPGGFIVHYCDGTNWLILGHDQGADVSVAFSAGNFTSNTGTFVVGSGDQIQYTYKIHGNRMALAYKIVTATTTGSPGSLFVAIPASGKSLRAWEFVAGGYDGTTNQAIFVRATAAGGTIEHVKFSGNWGAVTDVIELYGACLDFEIQ